MSKINVVLINPNSPYLENAAAYPPMGLLHVASAFEREGCNVRIVDFATEPHGLDVLKAINVDLVGITCVTPNVNAVRDIVSAIPRKIPTMVGGVHPTILPFDTLMQTGCTFVVRGEIERLPSLILSEIGKCGKVPSVFTGTTAPADDILKPARHLVDLHKYHPGGEDATTVYTSRGCPFSCNFCSKVHGRAYRTIPLLQVMEEVDEVVNLGFKKIVFGDDNMAIDSERLRTLCHMMARREVPFRLNMDARHGHTALFDVAAKSGCTDISFGIESGSQSMLDAMHKQTTVSANEDAIRRTQKAGMEAKAYFMVNFPGETEKTVQETLDWAEKVRPDRWLLSAFAPLPGSDAWASPSKYGITDMSTNWADYYLIGKNGSFQPCFETKYLTKQKQVELHEMMWNGLKEVLG